MSTKARFLITGGGGFIGSNLAAALVEQGERVRVMDDFSTGRRKNLQNLDVELIEASILETDALAAAVAGVEVIFHQAALASVPRSVARPLDSDRVNVHGTLCVLEAARAAGVRRVIYAGSSSAYGDTEVLPKREDMTPMPLSPYAVAKLAAEHYVNVYARIHGLETLTLRYFNVFGPRQDPNGAYAAVIPRWCLSALKNEPIQVNGDGGQTRDFSFITNNVHANLLAAGSAKKLGGEVVNISCGERISLLELADAIGDVIGRKVVRQHVEPRAGDVRNSLADITRARELLGFEPRVRWREGLAQTIAALRLEHGIPGPTAPERSP